MISAATMYKSDYHLKENPPPIGLMFRQAISVYCGTDK
jgi:hypothetical protein